MSACHQRPPPAAPRRERQRAAWQRRYEERVRDGRMVPDIGADEISFLIEIAEVDAADRRAVGCAIARAVTRN